jgi:uncharacterized membrane protein
VSFIYFREIHYVIELKKINVSKASAIESLKRIIRFRQQYKWGVIIGVFLGIAFLMVAFASMNQEFMIGGIAGGIIGGALGAKMWRFYNRTINDLESALREWNEVIV